MRTEGYSDRHRSWPGLEMPCSAASPHLHCYCRLPPQPALRMLSTPEGSAAEAEEESGTELAGVKGLGRAYCAVACSA